MNFLVTLFAMACSVLGSLCLLRAYLWYQAISARDPMVRFVWTFTDWLVGPVSSIAKPRGGIEYSCILAALICALVQTLVSREFTGLPATAASFILMPFALVLTWTLETIVWLVIVYAICSWIRGGAIAYCNLLGTLLDPLLRPLRSIIPTYKGFDFSTLALLVILQLILAAIRPASMGVLLI